MICILVDFDLITGIRSMHWHC